MDAVERNVYEILLHLAYPLDLAPSDYFLLPNLRKDIRGCYFRFDEEVKAAVKECVIAKDSNFFISVMMVLEHRRATCVMLDGNYIVKKGSISNGSKIGWLLIGSPSYKRNMDVLLLFLFWSVPIAPDKAFFQSKNTFVLLFFLFFHKTHIVVLITSA